MPDALELRGGGATQDMPQPLTHDVRITAVAELIADPSRAAILDALMAGGALPARELALHAGIRPSTASAHLAKLVAGSLLVVETRGRQRWYALAGADVAHALEALAVIAPPAAVRSLRESLITEQLRRARSCYDHLAGRLGVGLTEALVATGTLRLAADDMPDARYEVTCEGVSTLTAFGLDLAHLRRQRRTFARPCLDWSERRPHLAGALGAAFLARGIELGWIERNAAAGRAVRLTARGHEGFTQLLGPLDLP